MGQFQLSGSRRHRETWPPWDGKTVVARSQFPADKVEWVHVATLVPTSTHEATWGRAMTPPKEDRYPALIVEIIDDKHRILDGHHRYWNLVTGGWRGTVPVVRLRYWKRRLAPPRPRRAGTMPGQLATGRKVR
jgi:hypothetical protein